MRHAKEEASGDFFAWRAGADAEEAAAAWEGAKRRYRNAPHGERLERLRALRAAAERAMRADQAARERAH